MSRKRKFVLLGVVVATAIVGVCVRVHRGAQLRRLWNDLQILRVEQQALACQRWQEQDEVERARIVLTSQRQSIDPGELQAITPERARDILRESRLEGHYQPCPPEYAYRALSAEEELSYQQRRTQLLRRVARLGSPAVNPLLTEMLTGGPGAEDAQEALSMMGWRAVGALEAAFRTEKDAATRAWLMEALAGTEDRRAMKVLQEGLRDADPAVRRAAVNGLHALPDTPQLVFIDCLKDADADVREAAIAALAERGDEQAIEPLSAIARTDPALGKGPSYRLRNDARRALLEIARRTGAHVDLPPVEQPVPVAQRPER